MDFFCPYCKTQTNFTLIWDNVNFNNETQVIKNPHNTYNRFFNDVVDSSLWQCNNRKCKNYIFILSDQGYLETIFPFAHFRKKDAIVPEKIWTDYVEANNCFEVGAYNATASMCRRALQNIAIDKGSTEGTKLIKQLAELDKKGIITDILYKTAEKIRTVGNKGAHPKEYDVTAEEAKKSIAFTHKIMEHVYWLPAQLQELTKEEKPVETK